MSETTTSAINYKRGKLSDKVLKELYINLLRPRLVEEKMLILLRQGRISKWFSGIGQEAISVGATSVMQDHEVIFPMHRNLGVFTTRQVPLERLFCQWQGKAPGFTKGRDRSFHFGTLDYNIVGMISHLGPQLSLAGGVGLSHLLNKEPGVALAFTGEGGTSEGEFHEALNVASVWQLPVIFLIENNGYGLSTPTSQQYNCKDLADRAKGYGMRSYILDGNNVLEVYSTLKKIAAQIRKKPEPVFIECKTFRMRGHEEASGTKYVPKELMDEWAAKDPLTNYEQYLLSQNVITESEVADLRASIKKEINEGLEVAFAEPVISSTIENEIADVYAPYRQEVIEPSNLSADGSQTGNGLTEKRFIDSIKDGLHAAMKKHDNLVLMGQDIADYGGVFKITDGFLEEFGSGRVRNTPICESVIVGIGLGLSLKGYKSMIEMQFADFVTCAFTQIINNLAKLHYRWGTNADVVIRMPSGGGVGAGPFHSQTNEAWFAHTPGLKVVYPSNPYDAKGLLLASFEDPNPVLFFEHKALYRSLSAEIPDEYYTVEIGKAKTVREGNDLSIITYGMGVHWATEVVNDLGADAEIIDLRSLVPLDYEAIDETVRKTNRVLVLHEDSLYGGLGGEISAYISEHLFEHLDAPVLRVGALDTPIPFAKELEKDYLPQERLVEQLKRLMAY
ncbi:MAG: thiamine pyrophosphate-dependent enzyme [Saprospiraceae bacterium]